MKGGLLLDVVVGQSPTVLQLLAGEDQPLLVRRNALLVMDLGLDIVDRVGRLDLERDGLAREGLDEAIHQGYNVPFVSDLTRLRLIASCCGTSQNSHLHCGSGQVSISPG